MKDVTEQRYWLASHVHLYVTDDYAVLLDLRRDKYIGLAREHMIAIAERVVGWPATTRFGHGPPTSALLSKMLATGILTTDPKIGKEARPASTRPARFPAIEADLEYRPPITARDVLQVIAAAMTVRAELKWRPIEAVVARVRLRKERCSAAGELNIDAARPVVEAFLHLRPLFFTTKDECLFDSLVLIELLARHRMFPDWILGVSTKPFKAHSWVQAGDRVLNDLPERVSKFMPILVV